MSITPAEPRYQDTRQEVSPDGFFVVPAAMKAVAAYIF